MAQPSHIPLHIFKIGKHITNKKHKHIQLVSKIMKSASVVVSRPSDVVHQGEIDVPVGPGHHEQRERQRQNKVRQCMVSMPTSQFA